MGRTGGKVVLVSGLLGMACAGFEMVAGIYGSVMHIERASAVVGLGVVGALLCAVVVGLGVAGRREPRRWVGGVTIAVALCAVVIGGTFVAVPMLGAFAGGAMLLGGSGRRASSDAGRIEGDVTG